MNEMTYTYGLAGVAVLLLISFIWFSLKKISDWEKKFKTPKLGSKAETARIIINSMQHSQSMSVCEFQQIAELDPALLTDICKALWITDPGYLRDCCAGNARKLEVGEVYKAIRVIANRYSLFIGLE